MKHAIVGIVFLAALLLGGCATSTIQSRRLERLAAYDALPPETRAFVDQGQIRVGMNQDAVYIAWGPPAQILQGETGAGVSTTWLYHETVLNERTRWRYRAVTRRGLTFLERCPDFEFESGNYVSAQIVFLNGAVNNWQTLPRPVY